MLNKSFLLLLLLLYTMYMITAESRSSVQLTNDNAYYDIIYDDSCPNGWKSNAVRDYMFIGRGAQLLIVDSAESCLRHCYTSAKCKSVNIFKSRKAKLLKGPYARVKCFLNQNSQYDKPELLVPLTGSVYYDSIHCTTANESL